MYATTTKPLTFTEFLFWDDGSGRDFELVDGIPRPLSEPNANHEDLIQRLCTYLEAHSQTTGQPTLRLLPIQANPPDNHRPDIYDFVYHYG